MVAAEIGFVRRVRRFSDEGMSRLTVGGFGLFGHPLAGLRSEDPLRKRVLFRDSVAADGSGPELVDVPDVDEPAGTLKDLTGLPAVFFVEHEDAAVEAATTDIFASVLRGLGSGRTLRSCITDVVEYGSNTQNYVSLIVFGVNIIVIYCF